jgi:hypothetical protein
MKDAEKLLLEAVASLLDQQAKLGLAYHKPPQEEKESSHFVQFQHETIGDMYQLAVLESRFASAITAAFGKVHGHKYVDDPTFKIDLDTELRSMGVPGEAREAALTAVDKILKEMRDGAAWSERDAGWHPNLDEIKELTTHADCRKMTHEPPWTGGGPAPQPPLDKAVGKK